MPKTTVVSKPGAIEAWRIPHEVNDDLHALCKWAHASLRTTAMQHPRVRVPICHHDDAYVEAFPGEWIVKYPGANVGLLTNKEFIAMFDVVTGAQDE